MSHNRYRVNSRVRRSAAPLQPPSKSAKCRKSLRKPHLLLASYQRRAREFKWLPTHLWHAKRMKMVRYFGYKVAWSPNDKGTRACLRFASRDCCLYDKSYQLGLLITGREPRIQEFLRGKLDPPTFDKVFRENR